MSRRTGRRRRRRRTTRRLRRRRRPRSRRRPGRAGSGASCSRAGRSGARWREARRPGVGWTGACQSSAQDGPGRVRLRWWKRAHGEGGQLVWEGQRTGGDEDREGEREDGEEADDGRHDGRGGSEALVQVERAGRAASEGGKSERSIGQRTSKREDGEDRRARRTWEVGVSVEVSSVGRSAGGWRVARRKSRHERRADEKKGLAAVVPGTATRSRTVCALPAGSRPS